MPEKRPGSRPRRSQPARSARPKRPGLTLRSTATGAWEFVLPRCAREREDDLAEVALMLEAGEQEIAIDELRWLLNGCDQCLEAHRLLGDLALAQRDLPLARGHYGYAHDLALQAWRDARSPLPVPHTTAANRTVLENARALVHCLELLGRAATALEVAEQLLAWDPADPLDARSALERCRNSVGSSTAPPRPDKQPSRRRRR
jgi:tetratricopeptide (TPR) repeat protein